jgi:hypothetical protein
MRRSFKFSVSWEKKSKSYIAVDEDGYVLGKSLDQINALAIAIKDAELAQRSGARVTVVAKDYQGDEKLMWRRRV